MTDEWVPESNWSTTKLLRIYATILSELRSRGVVRSTNNPVADYAEGLVSKALGLEVVAGSNKGFDAMDPATGARYEVKARRVTSHNTSRQLSAIRSLEGNHFDYLAGVLFDERFEVNRACVIPIDVVREIAAYRKHVNAWILHLRDGVWTLPNVLDITAELRRVQATAE